MRILMVANLPLGPDAGAPGATLSLGQALGDRGHTVTYLVAKTGLGRVAGRMSPLVFPLRVAAHLRSATTGPYDVIDGASGDAWTASLLRGRRCDGRPALIARSHGLEATAYEDLLEAGRRGEEVVRWRQRLYRRAIRLPAESHAHLHADAAIFLNGRDRQFALRRMGLDPERTAVIHNGLPESLLGKTPHPAEGNKLEIAQVGSFIRRKGVREGTRALVAAMEREPRIRLNFLGTGVPATTVLAQIPNRFHSRVRVVSSFEKDQLPTLLAPCEIAFAPSHYEGFSMALIEAMACGLAPISTNIPGALEVVRDGYNGLIVPVRDESAMAAAVLRLAGDEDLLRRLRCQAVTDVQQRSWARVAAETEMVYCGARERAAGGAV